MPKKKVTVTYFCEICFNENESRESAFACEERGMAFPEFKRHEVVELVNLLVDAKAEVSSGFYAKIQNGTKGIVHDEGGEEKLNPHLLPAYYNVWIQTPGGPYTRELATISRNYLRKVTVRDGALCPLCASSTEITKIVCDPFLTMGSELLPLLKNLPARKCLNCNAEFFTTEQSRYAESVVKKKFKWPLANTRHLIRKHQFQY